VNRAVRILLILLVGSLVLWESISWGTRTWVKYGILKQPLPSLTTLIPTSMIQSIMMLLTTTIVIVVLVVNVLRSRKIFGLIPLDELVRHAVILGPTGSGKTSAAKAIIDKVLRSAKPTVKVAILDWKGEYRSLPDATIIRKVNLWDLKGRSPAEKAAIAVELLREVTRDIADVSPASAALLLKELTKLYNEKETPTTKDVVERVDKFMQRALAERRLAEANMAAAILRRLYWLQVDEERPDDSVYRNSTVTIYDLSATPNYLKTLYSIAVLMTKYYEALKRGTTEELLEIIIAEECQNYVRGRRFDDPPLIGERIIFELRSFGVGVVLICPDPELLPSSILKDVATVISMSPDAVPRFALERFLFRASLEEAEKTLKELKRSRMIIYFRGRLHFFRRLPRIPKALKVKPEPKGDRMGVTHPWAGGRSLRVWPILPHRSPGRPAPKVMEVEEGPKVVEVKAEPVEELKLEEELEEGPEIEVKEAPKPITEVPKTTEIKEKEFTVEEEIKEPEPAPKGPPIPSALPYRGSLCPAGCPHLTPVHRSA
jgi:hypothetical protein